ncbi:MFS transporter, partial [Mesorhizobium sp. M7A.T.Ca.TU.009.01.1.1]
AFCLFVLLRVFTTGAVPVGETGSFAPMTAQAPLPVELAFSPDDEGRH